MAETLDTDVAGAASGATAKNFFSDPAESDLRLDSATLSRRLRHSVNDTALLILAEGAGAVAPHGKQALRSILAHSGQNHADGVFPCGLRSRVKQDIDRRAMAAHPLLASNDANVVRP